VGPTRGNKPIRTAAAVLLCALLIPSAQAQVARGTIRGHVKLEGKLPGNPVIRMGMDPMCARLNEGRRQVQEYVAAALDGSLANVFVRLEGTFPATPVPKEPVVIDQRACMYVPRMVGARVGQTLQVRNDDELLHNVHSLSAKGNTFNVSEPKAGMAQSFTLKDEEMLRIKCDIHSWMTTFVGIVDHPYFSVSSPAGTFEIRNVPAGSYDIVAWHERYGPLRAHVAVRAGATATVNFTYPGEPPAR
jgi:plastocyanin